MKSGLLFKKRKMESERKKKLDIDDIIKNNLSNEKRLLFAM